MKLAFRFNPRRLMSGARRSAQRRTRGLSLVELMVGVTIGLFVVAAASMLVGTQLGENRKLILETQLGQDLRATADIIARELRRSGASEKPWEHIASETAAAAYNNMADFPIVTPNAVEFRYARNAAIGEIGPWGFKLENGAIKTRLPSAAYQELTDPETMEVTLFQLTPHNATEQVLPCPKLCPGSNDTSCWPRLAVRSYTVTIEARSPRNHEVKRSLQSEVRLRNDQVRFLAAGGLSCPA